MAELKLARREKEKTAAEKPALSHAQVIEHLKTHPDFLARHPDLLEALSLSHKDGSAISLIERQVDILRAKNQKLEEKLERLMDAARDNEKRADNIHKLARTLIRAPSLAGVAAGLRNCLRDDFGVDELFIGLAAKHYKRHDIEGIHSIEPDGKIAKVFENFFRTRLIECGPIAEAQSKLLFAQAKVLPQSAAIVPLEKDKNLGLIALGARDAERFQPRQGKMFLELTAEMMSAAVRARL